MSFSRDVKRELAAIVPAAAHCRRAQLSGLLFGAGTFAMGSGGQVTVWLTLSLPAVARHALALLKPFGVDAGLRTVSTPPAGRRYEVVLGDERDLQLLNEVGVLGDALQVRMTVPGASSSGAAASWPSSAASFSAAAACRPPGPPCTLNSRSRAPGWPNRSRRCCEGWISSST